MQHRFRRLVLAVCPALLLAVSLAEGGTLYVSDSSADTIYQYDSSGQRSVFATEAAGSAPRGIAVDAAGNLYVANFGFFVSDVEKFSPTGQDLGVFAKGILFQPETLVFDHAGNLYVTSIGNGTVQKFSATGQFLGVIVSGLSRAVGLAIDASDTLYVADRTAIQKYSTAGAFLGTFATGLSAVNGLAFDASGNLYAADAGNGGTTGTIHKFSATGGDLGNIITGLSLPFMGLDDSGNLDVISFGSHSVHRYTTSGGDLGVIDDNLAGPTFGLFSPVPEPASLISLGLGALGMAGYVWRRRRPRAMPAA